MAMILHELCTNALKYGALSNDAGRIAITWTARPDEHSTAIDLTWSEDGGPPVETPDEEGFGTRLIANLSRQMGGDCDFRYAHRAWSAASAWCRRNSSRGSSPLFKPRVLRHCAPQMPAAARSCRQSTRNAGGTMNVHAAPAAKATPALPSAKPESIGLSPLRLERMRDAFQREIDKGTTPGVVTMVARRGQIGWFEAQGRQDPAADAPMAKDSIFRIFSMTKPLVSLGIMMLVEDGELLLNDPLAKFIPEFASQKVGIERNGAMEFALPVRPITIQDLLRHTSGISYEITGMGMVQRMYAKAKVFRRDITNEEHAKLIAGMR